MVKQDFRTIVVDVSGHGLGHIGQITPIIQALVEAHPKVRVIVRSPHPTSVIRSFVGATVEIDTPPPEAMLVMRDPTIVDIGASAEAYRTLHARWDEHLGCETARLAKLAAAVLVSDIPYLSLAAAKRAGIPTVALCSLNWLDLYRAYCGDERDAPAILRTIAAAYRSADVFLQPQPHMPMADLANRRSIGPLARIGRQRKDEIKGTLGIGQSDKIVLVTFGGIPSNRPLQLPAMEKIHWLVGSGNALGAASAISQLDMSFIDILASCDAAVSKVGYCTFVEAACNGIGLVSAPRADWPESRHLIEWAKRNANFALAEGGLDDVESLQTALSAVLNAPRKPAVPSWGIAEAVEVIAGIAGVAASDGPDRQVARRSGQE